MKKTAMITASLMLLTGCLFEEKKQPEAQLKPIIQDIAEIKRLLAESEKKQAVKKPPVCAFRKTTPVAQVTETPKSTLPSVTQRSFCLLDNVATFDFYLNNGMVKTVKRLPVGSRVIIRDCARSYNFDLTDILKTGSNRGDAKWNFTERKEG